MTGRDVPEKIVLATHNEGKVREIRDLLEPYGLRCESANELGLEEPEETGATFVENAELKARAAATVSDMPALADDSGLAVHALGGAPGIYSARWAGPKRDFTLAMERVHEELTEKENRKASFVCVLSLAWPDGATESFEGRVNGRIVWPPRGERGFGYDPVFVPDGYDITFGEMEPEQKHRMSHRAEAFSGFVRRFLTT